MTLSNYQASFNGLTVGAGTLYEIFSVDGLDDFTTVNSDKAFSNLWGTQPGGRYLDPRNITLGLQLFDPALYDGTIDDAFVPPSQAAASALLPFNIKFPDREELTVQARVTKRARPRTPETEHSVVQWLFELNCPDPRLYSAATLNGLMSPYLADTGAIAFSSGSGVDAAFLFSLGSGVDAAVDFAGVGPAGSINAVNNGTVDTYPTLTFTTSATVNQWHVVNDTTGEEADFTWALQVGQTFVVDFAAVATGKVGAAVTMNGVTQYAAWTPPRVPLRLAPGNNTLRFVIDSGPTDVPLCAVSYRSAYL